MKTGALFYNESRLSVSVFCTENILERMRGLLWKKPLSDNCSLWISPCNSVHTFFMRYPIDVVFLSRDGVIRKISREIKPWSMASCWGANSVLELYPGAAAVAGLVVGGRLQFKATEQAAGMETSL